MPDSPKPLPQDHQNARIRREVAGRQAQEYDQVLAWALGKFGPGWLPSGRYFLIEKSEEDRARYTGERPTAAATVYIVKNMVGRKRFFTVDAEAHVQEHASMEAGFGPMLLEQHPSAPVMVENKRGASPRRGEVWLLVAEGNCVAARRGGEQPEANDPSATHVNSIRPVALASLLGKGEAQVTPATSCEG